MGRNKKPEPPAFLRDPKARAIYEAERTRLREERRPFVEDVRRAGGITDADLSTTVTRRD